MQGPLLEGIIFEIDKLTNSYFMCALLTKMLTYFSYTTINQSNTIKKFSSKELLELSTQI